MEQCTAQLKDIERNHPQKVEEDIPEYTVLSLSANKIRAINIEKYAAKRVIRLFVSHLLDTEMVKIHEKMEKHFLFNGMTFRSVMVRGIIVNIQSLTFKTKSRVLISVDDGTGVLDCYVEDNAFLEDARNEVNTKLQHATELISVQSDSLITATVMMLQSMKEKLNKAPGYKKLRLGDTVELIGSLSEYNGKRSCFVSQILKATATGNINYLKHLQYLYDTAYF